MADINLDTARKAAQFLADVTSNLAAYIEEQAQLIAKPKIEAAERACDQRLKAASETHQLREQRSTDLIAELRRHIVALEKYQEKARLRETRVRAVADDLYARGDIEVSTQLRNALNFVGHMVGGGR